MPTYVATYVVANREITLTTDGSQPLSIVAAQQTYLRVKTTQGDDRTIDLSRYVLLEPRINLTQTLAATAAALTDLQLDGYAAIGLPGVDPVTGAFTSRINAYDALAAPDMTVSWTAIGSPGIRDDVYQRALMNDLVLSSTQRDLSNTLVAVNGVFHKTYLFNHELYVLGGFFNIKNSRNVRVSAYDTGSVGGHTVLPVTIPNIDASNYTPLSGVTLTFPNVDFTNKTVLLVLDGYLHALDDTYRIINSNRIVIDTCKIDLIDGFLHNPNTIYDRFGVADAAFEELLKTQTTYPPDVYDKIMWYLWNQTPTPQSDRAAPINLVAFDPAGSYPTGGAANELTYYSSNANPWAQAVTPTIAESSRFMPRQGYPDAPAPADSIYAFLVNYPNVTASTNQVMLVDNEWSTKYKTLTNVVGTIPTTRFQDPSFVYNLLLSPRTFFVVINNPNLYRKTYSLVRMQAPSQYEHRGQDTPRGTLLYNRRSSVPYLIYSGQTGYQHTFSINFDEPYLNAYKTSLNPGAVPSPLFDLKSAQVDNGASLLELFAAAA
jgi:hypothetical protein